MGLDRGKNALSVVWASAALHRTLYRGSGHKSHLSALAGGYSLFAMRRTWHPRSMCHAPYALPVKSQVSTVPVAFLEAEIATPPLRLMRHLRITGSPPSIIVTPARALPKMSILRPIGRR
jgi:hypothetical protein